VRVEDSIVDYIMAVVRATRKDDRIRLGASTRASQFLLRVAKASAYYEGRDYVAPEDVKGTAAHVLGHRLILKTRTSIPDSDAVVKDILERTPVPV